MPEQSPTLSLPYLQPAQAQKHVTHNEALRILDAVTQLSVLDVALATPPAAPTPGDRYIVGPAATSDWVDQENAVALWVDSTWQFFFPGKGWRADIASTGDVVRFDGLAWVALGGADVQNAPLVGINTTADATNRLSVSSQATLLNHEGGGHQLKLNKALETDTASLLFQTGFSGRAEMGTAGDDAFAIKVSPDGSAFLQALSVDPTTGFTTLGQGTGAEQLSVLADADATIQVQNTGGSGGAAVRMTDTGSGGDWKFQVTGSGEFKLRNETAAFDILQIDAASPHEIAFAGPVALPSYTVASLPDAGTAGAQVFVSDETGGSVPAFSDGSDWRRVTDRAIVS